MSLTTHNYLFISEEEAFFLQYKEVFCLLKNAVIEQIYALWDCIDEIWFDNGPMLVKTSVGVLRVHVKSDNYISIGWNDISLSEKPRWFDEKQAKGLNWYEDLEWRKYSKNEAQQICGEKIKDILFHAYDKNWGIGIGLKCWSEKCLWIYDAGDIITAKIEK